MTAKQRASTRRTALAALAGMALVAALAALLLRQERAPSGPDTTPVTLEALALDPARFDAPLDTALASALGRLREREGEAGAWGELGMLLHAHDLHDRARLAYRRASELAPEDARWPALRGHVSELLSRYEEARMAYTRAVELDPAANAARVALAQMDREQGEDRRAERRFRQALVRDPGCTAAHLGLGQVLAARGEDEAAQKHLERALELYPASAATHAELARLHARRGDAGKAAFHERWSRAGTRTPLANLLLEAVARRGVSYPARLARGRELAASGRWAAALEEFRAAAALGPARAEPVRDLARCQERLGDLDAAVASLRRATELAGDAARFDAWLELATIAERRELWGEAETALEGARRIRPQHPVPLVRRARFERRRTRLGVAASILERVLAEHPDSAEALVERGRVALAEGAAAAVAHPTARQEGEGEGPTRQAVELFDRARELRADLPSACEGAAEARMHLRGFAASRDEADALLREALELYSEHVFYFPRLAHGFERLARALLTAGRPADAREVVRTASRRWPADPVFARLRERLALPGASVEAPRER
jgi:tetratricopeptide (TPR) repeat protein